MWLFALGPASRPISGAGTRAARRNARSDSELTRRHGDTEEIRSSEFFDRINGIDRMGGTIPIALPMRPRLFLFVLSILSKCRISVCLSPCLRVDSGWLLR